MRHDIQYYMSTSILSLYLLKVPYIEFDLDIFAHAMERQDSCWSYIIVSAGSITIYKATSVEIHYTISYHHDKSISFRRLYTLNKKHLINLLLWKVYSITGLVMECTVSRYRTIYIKTDDFEKHQKWKWGRKFYRYDTRRLDLNIYWWYSIDFND